MDGLYIILLPVLLQYLFKTNIMSLCDIMYTKSILKILNNKSCLQQKLCPPSITTFSTLCIYTSTKKYCLLIPPSWQMLLHLTLLKVVTSLENILIISIITSWSDVAFLFSRKCAVLFMLALVQLTFWAGSNTVFYIPLHVWPCEYGSYSRFHMG